MSRFLSTCCVSFNLSVHESDTHLAFDEWRRLRLDSKASKDVGCLRGNCCGCTMAKAGGRAAVIDVPMEPRSGADIFPIEDMNVVE